jgi:hypothetical protein
MKRIRFDMAVHPTHTNHYLGEVQIAVRVSRLQEYMDALKTLGYKPYVETVESEET